MNSYDEQVVTALRTAADAVRPPVDELVRAGLERGERRRRRRNHTAVALGAGVVAVLAVGVALGPRLGTSPAPAPAGAGPAPVSPVPTGACASSVLDTALPSWATTGFSDPTAPQPHVLGDHGLITAILWGPLSYPEAKTVANKVLWATRTTAQALPLDITATLEGGTTVVTRQLPTGPGPSYLELPHTGCWHLALTWDGGTAHDDLDLFYGSPG